MTSIFPNVNAGGVVIRNPAGAPTNPPNVQNAYVPPADYAIGCPPTALPSDCFSKIEPAQINAIVSEMLCFARTLDPNGPWDCTSLCNLSAAFTAWVAAFTGEIVGGSICGSAQGPGTEEGAQLIYCDGAGVAKQIPIQGENSLLELLFDLFCASPSGLANNGSDGLLYCDGEGNIGKVPVNTFQLFRGEWVQANGYNVNQMVRRNKKLYTPNATITPGTAFLLGTAGQTWYEVSATEWDEFDPTENYLQDAVIQYNGKTYAANADIPAGTPFMIGTSGATWRLVTSSQTAILDHSVTTNYAQYAVVTVDGLLYRANVPQTPGPFVAHPDGPWLLIGGERNFFQGDWIISHNSTRWTTGAQWQYLLGEMVQQDGKLWRANDNIPLATAFTLGTTGATWAEVSQSAAAPFVPGDAYSKDAVIQYTDGKYYAANDDIPAGTPFVIGTTGATWRLVSLAGGAPIINAFSNAKAYAARELATLNSPINNNGDMIMRAQATGVPAGPYNAAQWSTIGERSKYRGRWEAGRAFLGYDVVNLSYILSGVTFDELFVTDADLASGQPAPQAAFNWRPLNRNRGAWFAARTYFQGDVVWHMGSQWTANANIALNAAFSPGLTGPTWRNSDYMLVEFDPLVAGAVLSIFHLNKYNIFDEVAPKSITIPANATTPFVIGTVFTGVSVGGQMTIIAGAGVTIRTPRTLLIRNGDYAAFTLIKVATNEWHLAGDLA